MIAGALRLDRAPAAITGVGLVFYLLMALSELTSRDAGMTSSLWPYLGFLIGVAWAAPVLARELDSGQASWAWSMGASRRRWLAARLAPLAAGSVVAGCALGGLVLLSRANWPPFLRSDMMTATLVSSAFPAVVAFCLLAAATGVAAAALTGRLVPAVGSTLVVLVALSYLLPAAVIRLAARRTGSAAAVHSGHILSRHGAGAAAVVTYLPNSDYWPAVAVLCAVLVVLSAVLALAAAARIARLPG